MRTYTNKLIELAEDGLLSWETIAREALAYMAEDDVAEMATCAGMVDDEGDDDGDDDEGDEGGDDRDDGDEGEDEGEGDEGEGDDAAQVVTHRAKFVAGPDAGTIRVRYVPVDEAEGEPEPET